MTGSSPFGTIQSRQKQGRVKDAPTNSCIYRILPRRLWPYAQLARWDRPIGWQLLLAPCWWSVALVAASNGDNFSAYSLHYAWYLFLFFVGSVVMRGAGCTYNDLVDENIDMRVDRTKSRPLPSKQVSRMKAKMFLLLQAFIGLIVLLQFNFFTIILGACSLFIVAFYPFVKRFSNWPQLVLGMAFSWGALLGWTAWYGHLDLPPLLLYLGALCWTVGYDTIYAHQDREDDALIGVRSTARLFGHHTKLILLLFYVAMLGLIGAAFFSAGLNLVAYGGLGVAALHLLFQIVRLDIDDAAQCLRLFRANFHVGWLIFSGLVLSAIFTFSQHNYAMEF